MCLQNTAFHKTEYNKLVIHEGYLCEITQLYAAEHDQYILDGRKKEKSGSWSNQRSRM